MPPIPSWLDWLFHGSSVIAVITLVWKVVARLNREESLKADYPPHRHVRVGSGSKILYPHEYRPSHLETLSDGD